eukprot:287278-Alexandrium_andersonii.AAC.1
MSSPPLAWPSGPPRAPSSPLLRRTSGSQGPPEAPSQGLPGSLGASDPETRPRGWHCGWNASSPGAAPPSQAD